MAELETKKTTASSSSKRASQKRPVSSRHALARCRSLAPAISPPATPPDRFIEAATVSWATDCHFLLARIDGDRMLVRAIGESEGASDPPQDIVRRDPNGGPVVSAMESRRGNG